MHIHQMPPVWLEQMQLRPKTKAEEVDFEKLREAAAKEAERLAAEREKQNRQSAANREAALKRRRAKTNTDDDADFESEETASKNTETQPIKVNLLA